MKKHLSIILAVVTLVSLVFLSGCQHSPEDLPLEELAVTEFPVGMWYADENQNIQENHLYVIESQQQMDELFATYPSDGLPEINFNEQSVLAVWGAYSHSRSEVDFEKVDENNYVVKVTLTPSIDTGPDIRWCFACTTNRKLASTEHVTLTIIEE